MATQKVPDWFRETRVKASSPMGTATFTVLRLVDPFLQYGIMTRHIGVFWIAKLLGGSLLAYPHISAVGLSALPTYQKLMLGFSIGSAVKQVFWVLFISQEKMDPSFALAVAIFNTISNGLNTALSLWTKTALVTGLTTTDGRPFENPWIVAGTVLYTTGILAETISEIQRAAFKKNPKNEGKPYSGGLFGLARNINYGAYAVWRAGFALASAGPVWGIPVFAFFFLYFVNQAVPLMNAYCEDKYGVQYTEVQKKVPYKLIPYIY